MQYTLSHQRLPWSSEAGERRFFAVTLVVLLAALVALSLFIHTYEVAEVDRKEAEELPPQLARLVERQKAKPAPVLPESKPERKPEPPKPIEKPEVPKPAPVVKPSVKKEKKLVETKKSTAEEITKAREVAQSSGLLAMQSELQALNQAVSSKGFSNPSKQTSSATQAASVSTTSDEALAALSSQSASSQQSNPQTTSSELEAAAQEEVLATADELALAKAEREEVLGRKEDDIQIVVEGLRSTFNLLYNRALRNDPFLEGKLVLKATIEPNGVVSAVEMVESTLSDEALVSKLIARMRLTNFGPSRGGQIERVFPFEFTPS